MSSGDTKILNWKKVNDPGTLVLWPGTTIAPEDLDGPDGVLAFLKERFPNLEFAIVGCVATLPDTTESGVPVEGTGGRHDFFFGIKGPGVASFALKRFDYGMRWWQDVYFNNQEDIYPLEFRRAYPSDI